MNLPPHIHVTFTDPTPTQLYTLSLHDALPISRAADLRPLHRHARAADRRGERRKSRRPAAVRGRQRADRRPPCTDRVRARTRSEEHTSELQSHVNLVCRLLLEKKKKRGVCTSW